MLGDAEIERVLGRRLKRQRLNRNMSQAELAKAAGISLKTVTNVESGNGTSLGTVIAMLRGLDLLGHLDLFIPEPAISPVELAKLKGKERKRATGNRGGKSQGASTGLTGGSEKKQSERKGEDFVVREPRAAHWKWGDEDEN